MSSSFTRTRVAILAIVAGGSGLLPAQDPPAQEPAEEPLSPTTVVAPFTTVAFLEGVQREIARRQLYRELTSGIYLHKKPRLVWAARDNGSDIDWRRAGAYCDELQLAGFDDWRLPSLQELKLLLRPMAGGAYSTPEEIQLSACCPWSSTEKSETSMWNFNFRFRKPFSGSLTHTFGLRALCVRDWLESDRLPVPPEDFPDLAAAEAE